MSKLGQSDRYILNVLIDDEMKKAMENSPLTNGSIDCNRTLYIGGLDPIVTEPLLHMLFAPYGRVTSLKLIDDPVEKYCFLEFVDRANAAGALSVIANLSCMGRRLKANWATCSGGKTGGNKSDTSRHSHIFVGDLSADLDTDQLRSAFAPFGEISDCRVLRDPQTQKSKGYGFVSFVNKADAEAAIAGMNGQWLGQRPIRTNWASRKIPSLKSPESGIGPNSVNKQLNYDEVYTQTSVSNCTVYCGGILNGLSEDIITKSFSPFGPIQEIRVFKEKGYAFIKFCSKEAATNAIVYMNNQQILGQPVKCSWGKMNLATDNPPIIATHLTLAGPAPATPMYPYGQMNSAYSQWPYHQSYGGTGSAATATAINPHQPPQQFAAVAGTPGILPHQYHPSYAQFYPTVSGSHQQQQQQPNHGYNATYGMNSISGWAAPQQTPQMANNHHQHAAATSGNSAAAVAAAAAASAMPQNSSAINAYVAMQTPDFLSQ